MKCKSVACVWSGSPPSHQVTAVAALDEPPTLYTGGSDGSIIWWNLISNSEGPHIEPVAMLCGHAASIADLGICFPFEDSDKGKLSTSCDVLENSINCGGLISACTDGVLCIWSRASGHCRCRRKIPPWAGSPFMIRTLPKNRRYVCISCCFVNQEPHLINWKDGDEHLVDGDLNVTNHLKCTVIIIDSYTLAIVQTVFHGSVPIGPLKSMAVVFSSEVMEQQSVIIIDSFGKILRIPILKAPEVKGKKVRSMPKDLSICEAVDWVDVTKKKESLVAFSKCGDVLAFVHRTYCTFRQAYNGTVLGHICFSEDQLSLENELHVVGGMFLHDDTKTSSNDFVEDFVAWNSIGTAVIYRSSYLSNQFKFELLCTIQAALQPDRKIQISFVPLNKYLVRINSNCALGKEHIYWEPHITIWILPQQPDSCRNTYLECDMLGEGNIYNNWVSKFSPSASDSPNVDLLNGPCVYDENISLPPDAVTLDETDSKYSKTQILESHQEGQLVTSSMVISETYLAPYAIIYGFFNGNIEIVRFHLFFAVSDSPIQNPNLVEESHGQKLYLSGHNGAVLCLASHQMARTNSERGPNHILVSGSMDCTVRLWDLDSGQSIRVLHHHVAPVRQIIFPSINSDYPWSDCFLTVGDDTCVALISLHTLRVERLFPGHLHVPAQVLWDCVRCYIACLCRNHSEKSGDVLYIWDVKTGGRERVLHGASAHSMFDHFLSLSNESFFSGVTYGNTSASSLVFPLIETTKLSDSHSKSFGNGISVQSSSSQTTNAYNGSETSVDMKIAGAKSGLPTPAFFRRDKHPIRSSCSFPGVSTFCFDLDALLSLCTNLELSNGVSSIGVNIYSKGTRTRTPKHNAQQKEKSLLKELGAEIPTHYENAFSDGVSDVMLEHQEWIHSLEECLLKFSLSFLHLWNVDIELDNLLIDEMQLKRPDLFNVASGLLGDRGSMTLTFPGANSTLELWRSSSEYSALRSLTMVSLSQHLISISHSYTYASSALAAFYTRKFAEKISNVKPPLLQLLVSFWQHEIEHVKMAARSLFHCAASRAIPLSLCSSKDNYNCHVPPISEPEAKLACQTSDGQIETREDFLEKELEITSWLDSYHVQDWISCIGGTTQDAMTSQIIVAAALAIWYPTLVTAQLATVVVHLLVKLVMAMNEKYSAAAAEILAEGMESTWKTFINTEIPRLIGDIFFQLECVSGTSANAHTQNSAATVNIRETLAGILLPNLAMADIPGFLQVIERQIWSTASDSPVHVVSLTTLMRVVRGSPRNLAPYLDKVVTFILQTMDPGNLTMRRICLQNSMTALKDVVRVFPMISLNSTSTRLAVGDAIGDINNASIRIYDMQSMVKVKVLDASGPPGLPSFLRGDSGMAINSSISALIFSPDGEGLVAFSENGLMIRWWSIGSVWWEKLNRNLVPAQCTKLIFVPPWEGFSPNSTRSSILSSVLSDGHVSSPGRMKSLSELDRLKILIHNLDLSYKLEWVGEKRVKLTQHSHELGTFQL